MVWTWCVHGEDIIAIQCHRPYLSVHESSMMLQFEYAEVRVVALYGYDVMSCGGGHGVDMVSSW